jgi:hypothetical protein
VCLIEHEEHSRSFYSSLPFSIPNKTSAVGEQTSSISDTHDR